MAEKIQRTNTKTATTLMAYAQLEIDNSSTCIPRLCKFNIVRIVLNRLIDGGDSNAIVVAVKIESNKRTFRCCEIPLQQDGALDEPVNLQYLITYPHYFKRDINKIQIYVQRRKNRPLIGYKTLASGEINLNLAIQQPLTMDLQLYSTTKQTIRQDDLINHENQKRSVGYVSIVSMTSTIPNEHNLTTNSSTMKNNQSFNDDDEYLEDEELNSELEDSDLEFNSKTKQKFNRNLIRKKLIQMFKRKNVSTTTNTNKNSTTNRTSHQAHLERQSDIEEEDPPSDISDDTIPVDQWSIESVPKPGFTPVEHLQTLHFNEDDRKFENHETPIESDTSEGALEIDRTQFTDKIQTYRENSVKQCEDLDLSDQLPESMIFLYTGLAQSNITPSKFQEYNLSVIAIQSLTESKALLNNIIQRIQKYTSQSVIRIVLLGDDAFVNSFLQSYVECLASKPHEYMSYFRFYFIPLVFSYLAKFLANLDSQYESLFGNIDSTNETLDVKDLSQKISKYLKISQRTLSLPVGEVMLNRKGKSAEEDSSPTFLPFFCYVRLGTLSSSENQFSSIDDNALLTASLISSIPIPNSTRETKDSSDDENSQSFLLSNSPQSKLTNNLLKTSHADESVTTPGDVTVDYWTIIDAQKEKKDGIRTIKSSLKSNIRVLTITRQPTKNIDGKISPSLKMTYVTREKKLKMMKFGKKLKDLQNTKYLEPLAINGINRLVCTSKSQNVDLKVNIDGQEWDHVKFFQISSQWHTHIKYFPLAVFNDIRQ